MVLSDFVRAAGRRWYILLAGLLVTAGLVYGAALASPPEYNTRGLVLLLPSEEAVGEGGNPYLALGGLELPARILVSYFQSETAAADIAAVSADAEFTVGIEESTRGPVISIDVTAPTGAEALATLDFIVGEVSSNLTRLQSDVDAPTVAQVRSMPLTMDTEATRDAGGTLRLMLAAGGVGVVLSLIITFAIDRLMLGTGRRRRSNGREAEPVDPAGSPAAAEPIARPTRDVRPRVRASVTRR